MDILSNIDQSFISLKNGQIYKAVINDTEKILIEKALEKTHGNQILAARVLGLNRNTLRTKIKKLGVDLVKYRG